MIISRTIHSEERIKPKVNSGLYSSLLHTACFTLQWDVAKDYIRQDIGLLYKDNEKWGALHMAIFNRAPLEIVQMMLEKLPREEINAGIDNGSTPIYLAAEKDVEPQVIRLLLDYGADPNQPRNDTKGSSVTMASQQNINPEAMRLLLSHGPLKGNPNHQNLSDVTPVFMAAQRNVSKPLLQALLENGGDPNIPNREGGTAVFMAAQKNVAPELMQLLLEAKGDPNRPRKDGCTPLIFAAHQKNTSLALVLYLLQYGADPYYEDSTRKNAIEMARAHGNLTLHDALVGVPALLTICPSTRRVGGLIDVLPYEIFRKIKPFLYCGSPCTSSNTATSSIN